MVIDVVIALVIHLVIAVAGHGETNKSPNKSFDKPAKVGNWGFLFALNCLQVSAKNEGKG